MYSALTSAAIVAAPSPPHSASDIPSARGPATADHGAPHLFLILARVPATLVVLTQSSLVLYPSLVL